MILHEKWWFYDFRTHLAIAYGMETMENIAGQCFTAHRVAVTRYNMVLHSKLLINQQETLVWLGLSA